MLQQLQFLLLNVIQPGRVTRLSAWGRLNLLNVPGAYSVGHSGERTRPRVQLPAPSPATNTNVGLTKGRIKDWPSVISSELGGEGAAQRARGACAPQILLSMHQMAIKSARISGM
jgi:hypothetical protein